MNFSMRRMRARFTLIKGKAKLVVTFILCTVLILLVDHFLGLVAVILEKDFEADFSYPLDVDNFPALIENFRNGEPVEFEPINRLNSRPKFLEKADSSCDDFQLMLIMIKSAPQNIKRRNVIRNTWGNSQYLKNISNLIRANKLGSRSSSRLSLPKNHQEPNAVFKLVFLIGLISDEETDNLVVESNDDNLLAQSVADTSKSLKDTLPQDGVTEKQLLEKKLRRESSVHKDIVRIETLDSYSNNTFKTLMGIRWATEICTDFEYALLVDDDMYISIKNLLLFIESPATYPDGYEEDSETVGQIVDANRLFAGKVLFTKPIRQRIGSYSKWYLSLDEYPYNYFPRYMPAAAVIMSKQVVEDFYYASYYTKHFRFDDVFLGIMAYKMNIIPFSCSYFYVCHTDGGKCPGLLANKKKKVVEGSEEDDDEDEELTVVEQMEHVIAKHGLSPEQLTDLWRELTLSGRI